ncbi:MAG: hypothetical protein WDM77_19195 [Steroidobacteraceae bacterium]
MSQLALDRGYELIVPLPLEPHDYEHDFPASVTEFREILQRTPPHCVFVWPRSTAGDGVQSLDAAGSRDRQYREVGAFVAQQSHILLAIWDGVPDDTSAGTSGVVALKLGRSSAGKASAGAILDPDDSGPVFHVHAARAGDNSDASEQVSWLFPEDSDAELFHTVCSRIDRFNSETARATHPRRCAYRGCRPAAGRGGSAERRSRAGHGLCLCRSTRRSLSAHHASGVASDAGGWRR